ncbi:MAG TPA: ribulose-phosphate 3-epimerase [Tepidisphaeraceae bacterium]|jgi:ribulose-phosphate 3-epimerase
MSRDAFTEAGPKILPSILSADFANLAADVRAVESTVGSGVIHIDVMDGHLVPNLSLGVPIVKSLRPALPDLLFDVHLMIDEPLRYAPAFVKAGAQVLTFHVEAPEVQSDPIAAATAIRALGCRVGVTLKPGTPVERILGVLPHVDLVLVMSVEPGFGGQKFMPGQLDKVRRIKPLLGPNQRLEIDGGIGPDTIAAARAAGVDWFVVGSALFDVSDRRATAETLKRAVVA